jgi:hypothetical protein
LLNYNKKDTVTESALRVALQKKPNPNQKIVYQVGVKKGELFELKATAAVQTIHLTVGIMLPMETTILKLHSLSMLCNLSLNQIPSKLRSFSLTLKFSNIFDILSKISSACVKSCL